MSALTFEIAGAQAKRYSAIPAVVFTLRIASDVPIDAIALRVEIRIEPQWREYSGEEQTLLGDIFGTPDRWSTTLRSFSWADVTVPVNAFERERIVEVTVPSTYDFDVAATRFLHALGGGEVPLRFLFSGAVYRGGAAGLFTDRVSWSSECAYRMPVRIWREAMQACYGEDALIRVRRETLDRLHRYRALSGATSWDELFDRLLGLPT